MSLRSLWENRSSLIYYVLVFFFWQLRARDPASRGDRYMLVTFDEPPYGVKVICKWCHFYIQHVARKSLSMILYYPLGWAERLPGGESGQILHEYPQPRSRTASEHPADILLLCREQSRALRRRRGDVWWALTSHFFLSHYNVLIG